MNDLDVESFGTKFSDHYQFISLLGSGGFGRVVKALTIDGDEVAVKVILKKEFRTKDISKFIQEAAILSKMKHPNIVQFRRLIETESKILIEMALVKWGQLRTLLEQRRLSIEELRQLMKSIFGALAFIHSHGVVHRDIKPEVHFCLILENILIEDPTDLTTVKIADFGLSATSQYGQLLSGQCGTLIYMAPELFTSRIYSKPVDIWSSGIVMYMSITGTHPLYRHRDSVDTYKDKLANVKWQFDANFPTLAQNLFLRCVALDPTHRYNAHQVLEHPFITGNSDDPIPMSVPEMYASFTRKERLLKIMKGLMFLVKVTDYKVDDEYLKRCQVNSRQESLVDKEYIREMFANEKTIKAAPIEKPLFRYEHILRRIKDTSAEESQKSIKEFSEQKLVSQEQHVSSTGTIILKKTKKTVKKKSQISNSAKKPPIMPVPEVRSKSTNHKQNNENLVPKPILKPEPPKTTVVTPNPARRSVLLPSKSKSITSNRKISICEENCPDAYRYEQQDKAIHDMFMPRTFNKKLPFPKPKYAIQHQLLELNQISKKPPLSAQLFLRKK